MSFVNRSTVPLCALLLTQSAAGCREFIQNQERLKPQEERNKEEREKVDELRGSPMAVGTLEEIIDDNHAIVSSAVGASCVVHSSHAAFGTPVQERASQPTCVWIQARSTTSASSRLSTRISWSRGVPF